MGEMEEMGRKEPRTKEECCWDTDLLTEGGLTPVVEAFSYTVRVSVDVDLIRTLSTTSAC